MSVRSGEDDGEQALAVIGMSSRAEQSPDGLMRVTSEPASRDLPSSTGRGDLWTNGKEEFSSRVDFTSRSQRVPLRSRRLSWIPGLSFGKADWGMPTLRNNAQLHLCHENSKGFKSPTDRDETRAEAKQRATQDTTRPTRQPSATCTAVSREWRRRPSRR